MRKLLFITFANKQAYSGGGQGARRNLMALQATLGKDCVIPYIIQPHEGARSLMRKITRFSDVIKKYMGGLSDQTLDILLNILKDEKCTDLFIDSSQLGLVAKVVKRHFPQIRVYTSFQNIEYDFMWSNTFKGKDYLHFFWIPMAKYNEQCVCQYADKVILLNPRDAQRLKELYQRKADIIIPISMTDDYSDDIPLIPIDPSEKHEALFVGSYFFGNTVGLKWFCQEILPHTNINLTIVGSGMQAFAKDISPNENISIYSDVPDLTPYYEQADFMLLPITTGGGMKVKTAEALKYGKYIIGTPEALEGYDVNETIAKTCKTNNDFIQALRDFDIPYKFNLPSRLLFKQKHSFDATVQLFNKILQP